MPTFPVSDAGGASRVITVNDNARALAANSKPVVLSNEDLAAINALGTALASLLTAIQAVGTTTAEQLTNAQLRAAAVPVSLASQPLPAGAATSALQTTGNTALGTLNTSVGNLRGTEYEAVAALSTTQILGATGAIGDLLEQLLIVPTTTSPGPVSIRDGAGGTDIVVFAGGPDSISTLHPFTVPVGIRALAAGWRVTTGVGLSALASGNFT